MQIASTNPLEPVNAEIKRRTDVVGTFPSDPAIVRFVGALLLEQNDKWQLQRRYMQLEGLKIVSGNPLDRTSCCRQQVSPQLRQSLSYTTSWDTIRRVFTGSQARFIGGTSRA